jgi:endoglucanase
MKGIAIFATATLALAMTATPTLAAPGGGFYVPPPDKGAVNQIASDLSNAALLTTMVSEGHAVWFTGGGPGVVRQQVKETMSLASAQGTVPVLVAYNLPYRDCGQYSTGGARSTGAYKAWIDAFARGIGNGEAIVILEPDGLGIIPFYQPLYGSMEWCQPKDSSGNPLPGADPADRFAQINGAVDRLEQQPNVSVYLDGTHAAWLGAGEAADRLLKAGVQKAQGFFLNVSNYQTTANSITFGTWVSDCITAVTAGATWAKGHTDWCPSQYVNGVPDYSTTNVNAVNASYAGMLGGASPTTHFVIDTGRNGLGPWDWAAAGYDSAAQAQDWCNPPGRGLGIAPTTNTGNALVAAYLWVKVPGESDGSCNRSVAGSTTDPEWGNIVDPAAGAWFPQQALELAQLANPALLP